MANPFITIRQKAGDRERSQAWYQAQIKTLGSIRPNKLMANAPEMVTNIMPGNMYMFFYDAKLKDKLPFWDKFPLVLPFSKSETGFTGINLHYLPYGIRFKLLGALHELASDEAMGEDTKLLVNWKILNATSRYAPAKACVKQYLYSNVESRFLKIKYPDWITAALLPVERFVGASKAAVWSNTGDKY